jgi:heme-degrading monooxygenase HmoA
MITERVIVTVKPGTEEQFEAAVREAQKFPAQIDGFISLELHRGIESPSTFLGLLKWESVEAHEEGFRSSPQFAEWRALIGPYFAADPDMEHVTQVI